MAYIQNVYEPNEEAKQIIDKTNARIAQYEQAKLNLKHLDFSNKKDILGFYDREIRKLQRIRKESEHIVRGFEKRGNNPDHLKREHLKWMYAEKLKNDGTLNKLKLTNESLSKTDNSEIMKANTLLTQIIRGDITKEQAYAIANPNDNNITNNSEPISHHHNRKLKFADEEDKNLTYAKEFDTNEAPLHVRSSKKGKSTKLRAKNKEKDYYKMHLEKGLVKTESINKIVPNNANDFRAYNEDVLKGNKYVTQNVYTSKEKANNTIEKKISKKGRFSEEGAREVDVAKNIQRNDAAEAKVMAKTSKSAKPSKPKVKSGALKASQKKGISPKRRHHEI